MSANFESGFVVRTPAWHGLATVIEDAPTSEDALRLAGLDWTVEQTPMYVKFGDELVETGDIMNYRSSDNSLLGIVKGQYNVVQNKEAFSFTDELIGTGEVKYETAGSLRGGRVVWMLAQLPEMVVVGDSVKPYLLFSNSHDGSSAVKVICTPVRVVCNNTLNLALQGAKRAFSFVHKGNINNRLEEAKMTLGLAHAYNKAFNEEAEALAKKKLSAKQTAAILEKIFDVEKFKDGATKRQLENLETQRDNFLTCLAAPDLANFKGTAWGLVNAASDYVFHSVPLRQTKTFAENRMLSVINGSNMLDTVYAMAVAA